MSPGRPDRWASLREEPDRCNLDRCPADPTEGDIPEKIPGIKDGSRTMYFIIINRDFILIGV